MKKFYLAMLAVLFFASSEVNSVEVLVEAKAGAFFPSDKVFRDIYGRHGGGIFGGEITVPVWCGIAPWISADYFCNEGRSIGDHDATRVIIVPIGFGLKYMYELCVCDWNVDLYAGAGATYNYFKNRDHSEFVIEHPHEWGWGGIVKVGGIVNLDCGLFLDIFANYSFLKLDFEKEHTEDDGFVVRNDAKLSGFAIGVGLGYNFCL